MVKLSSLLLSVVKKYLSPSLFFALLLQINDSYEQTDFNMTHRLLPDLLNQELY